MTLPPEIESVRERIRLEVERTGAELVDLRCRWTGSRAVLTILADRKGGITLADCVDINQRLSRWFDSLSEPGSRLFGGGSYDLEVNSPGLDRLLQTESDFQRAAGQRVRVVFRAEDGKTRVCVGEVDSAANQTVALRLSPAATPLVLPLGSIVKAVRQMEWDRC